MRCIRLAAPVFLLLALGIAGAFPAGAAEEYDSSIFEETVIRTRYGEDLRTQLWFPAIGGAPALGRFPVIVVYTPYCDGEDLDGLFVRHGYVGALVYMPGLCGSEGHEEIFSEHVNLSGYDAIEWLGTQPWSTGKVGMFGASAEAISQIFTGQYHPPHLATIIPPPRRTSTETSSIAAEWRARPITPSSRPCSWASGGRPVWPSARRTPRSSSPRSTTGGSIPT